MYKYIKQIMRLSFVLLLSFGGIVHAVGMKNIGTQKVYKPSNLQHVKLYHKDNKFYVNDCGFKSTVQNCMVDKVVRNINSEKLKKFLKVNYLTLKKHDDNNYSIGARIRGLGGGPITGAVLYWGTKIAAYGAAAAGTATLVAGTGGVGAGALVSAAGSGLAGLTGGGAVVGITTSAVAGGVAGAGATAASTAAFVSTATVASTAGGIASVITTIESGAATLGLFGLGIPFLP